MKQRVYRNADPNRRVRETVSLPKKLADQARARAETFGWSLSEYLQHLIWKDAADSKPAEIFDDKISKELAEAIEDYKAGRYETLRTKEDIKKHFDSL